MATPKKPKDPRRMAETMVAEWFANIPESLDGFADKDNLYLAIDAIEDALEAEYTKEYGPIKPDQDCVRPGLAREAGYLVGVQVGLRLAGGAR